MRKQRPGVLIALLVVLISFWSIVDPLAQEAAAPAYYVVEGGAAIGPLSRAELKARVAVGTLGPSSLVWTDGQADWAAAEHVADLQGLFAADAARLPNVILPDFFVGRWTQKGQVPLPRGAQGTGHFTTEYRADMTFALNGIIGTGDKPSALVMSGEGTWSLEPSSTGGFNISLAGLLRLAGDPASTASAAQLINQNTRVEVVDHNTIRNSATGELLQRVIE